MILSGLEIRRRLGKSIVINPFDERKLNPNSYNVTLANKLLVYETGAEPLDMAKNNPYRELIIPPAGLVMMPDTLYLGSTVEYTEANVVVPMLEGRSSIGRLGVFIHATAGFGDCGFAGRWTLEISCVQPVRVYAGVEIGQIYFHEIQGECAPYAGKYQKNSGVQPSMLWKEFKNV